MFLAAAAGMLLSAVPFSVDGGLSRDVVDDVLGFNGNALNACFKGAPKSAHLKYRFGVTPEGHVGSLGFIDAKGLDGPRVTCLGTVIEQLGFPSADGGTNVELTIKLSPAADAGTPELEALPPSAFLPEWASPLQRCHVRSEPRPAEGRLAFELLTSPSGAVVQSRITESSPGLSRDEFLSCAKREALHWRFEAGPWRLLELHVIAAGSEKAAKKLFDPKAPAVFVEVPYLAPVSASGGLSKGVILERIHGASPQIKACYEFALQEKRISGKVSVKFTIGPTGSVLAVEVDENSTGDVELGTCIAERIKRLSFPPPIGGGNVNVTFPWIFNPAGEE